MEKNNLNYTILEKRIQNILTEIQNKPKKFENIFTELFNHDFQSQLEFIKELDDINLKGLIVAMYCPNLTEYEEDETGLKYFIKALDYNPYELGVLFNILSSFDELDMRQAYTRNNKHMFIKAYDILRNELFDSLDDEMKEQLKNQTSQYREFNKQISAKPS